MDPGRRVVEEGAPSSGTASRPSSARNTSASRPVPAPDGSTVRQPLQDAYPAVVGGNSAV